jgi:hypothetical protein
MAIRMFATNGIKMAGYIIPAYRHEAQWQAFDLDSK